MTEVFAFIWRIFPFFSSFFGPSLLTLSPVKCVSETHTDLAQQQQKFLFVNLLSKDHLVIGGHSVDAVMLLFLIFNKRDKTQ